jgi:anti-sigma28 factor (negative regulator of flagellin synthesis)
MPTGVKPKATDSHDFVVIPSDQVRVAPSDAEITDLLRAAARQSSEAGHRAANDSSGALPVPAVDATFRATAVNDDVPARKSSFGRRALRAIAALLLTLGIGAAALSWQTFGYAAKKALFSWAPKWAIAASLPLEKLGLASESTPSDDPPVAAPATTAASDQSPSDTGTPGNTAATTAVPSSDTAQQLQSMARDLANANQQVETLKASIAELKASQQQMTRDLAKVSDQAAKAKLAATTLHPPAHKPAPLYSSASTYAPSATPAPPPPAYRPVSSSYPATQAAAAPAAQPQVPPPPVQLQPEPGLGPAPRPPMPVQ